MAQPRKVLLVAGSRPPKDPTPAQSAAFAQLKSACVEFVNSLDPDTVVMTGYATGIDRVADWAAEERGMQTIRCPVTQKQYTLRGLREPLRRDNVMIQLADEIVVFVLNKSRGSMYVMRNAGDKLNRAACVELEA